MVLILNTLPTIKEEHTMKKIYNSGCIPQSWYKALKQSNPSTVTLSRVLKSGKTGKPQEYKLYGAEKTAEEVISRLEALNPGSHWVEA